MYVFKRDAAIFPLKYLDKYFLRKSFDRLKLLCITSDNFGVDKIE